MTPGSVLASHRQQAPVQNRPPAWLVTVVERILRIRLTKPLLIIIALALTVFAVWVFSLSLALVLISLCIAVQGLFAFYLMVYAWDDPFHVARSQSPRAYTEPRLSFTALLPVRHETAVVRETMRALERIDYPLQKTETIVICSDDDTDTIDAVQGELATYTYHNTRLFIYHTPPINKPHALNEALSEAKHDIVVVFDAEDEPHPELYHIANTVFERDNADVVQSGVQLMNYRSNWYSLFNVMEYYFWFKSSLHFFARMRTIPLGGNTVFFKRSSLVAHGGWNDRCLTEDAEVGLRMSAAGARVSVVYDAEHVTREETPSSLRDLIRQRTRWNQGFLQILVSGLWRTLPKRTQRILALYIFAWPFVHALIFMYVPISVGIALTLNLPAGVALVTNIPFYILGLHFIVLLIGLWHFTREYQLRFHPMVPLIALVCYVPYQLVLGTAAVRAVYRHVRNENNWEKTPHSNVHRNGLVTLTSPTYETI